MSHSNGKDKSAISKSVKLSVGIVTLLLGIAGPAAALAKRVIPSAPYSWTGFYLGGNVGYAWGRANQKITFHGDWLTDGTGDDVFLAPYGNKTLKPSGFLGGVQAGYNYQTNHWVPGVVIGLDYLGQTEKNSSGRVFNAGSGNTYTFQSSYTINWLITARPRLGYVIGGFLPYVTGGLAVAGQKFSQNIQQENLDFNEKGSINNTVYGWTVGAGADYAINNHWQIMLEYLYVDLPSSSTKSTGIFNGATVNYTATHSVQLDTNILHLGVIYKF